MSEQNLYKNYYQLIQAADDCVSKRLTVPALILIYTGIDSVSWIASNDSNEAVKKRFINWVNRWMLNQRKLDCTAEELYAARCGVLHTLTPSSNLSERNSIRKIAYAWGTAKRETLEKTITVLSKNKKMVAVHLDDLFWVFRNGFADYLEYVSKHTEEQERFSKKSGQHFSDLSVEKLNEFLNAYKVENVGTITNGHCAV